MNRTNYKLIILLLILVIITITGCSSSTKGPLDSKTDFLMDTVVQIDIYEGGKENTIKKVYARLFELENRMSKTIAISDVSKINKLAGKELLKINEDTYEVLEKSKELSAKTGGVFDPTIGFLVDLWKIQEGELDRDWLPADTDIKKYKSKIDYNKIELDGSNKARLSDPDIALDLGAIVKGYAADEAKRILKEEGVVSGIVDLGGNLYMIGGKPDGNPWSIGIQDPFLDTGEHMGVLSIKDKSVVTSGNYERYFEFDGKRYHHILDPKTGYPSENNLASVTVVSDESIVGDVFSTAFYILGYEESMELMKDLDEDIDAIFITKDKQVFLTEGIKDKFELDKDKDGFKLID